MVQSTDPLHDGKFLLSTAYLSLSESNQNHFHSLRKGRQKQTCYYYSMRSLRRTRGDGEQKLQRKRLKISFWILSFGKCKRRNDQIKHSEIISKHSESWPWIPVIFETLLGLFSTANTFKMTFWWVALSSPNSLIFDTLSRSCPYPKLHRWDNLAASGSRSTTRIPLIKYWTLLYQKISEANIPVLLPVKQTSISWKRI